MCIMNKPALVIVTADTVEKPKTGDDDEDDTYQAITHDTLMLCAATLAHGRGTNEQMIDQLQTALLAVMEVCVFNDIDIRTEDWEDAD